MTLTGYLNQLSVHQGDDIDCMISSSLPDVELDVVRLLHGDDNPAGPGRKIQAVRDVVPNSVQGRLQQVHLGSCVVVSSIGEQELDGLSLEVLIQPMTPTSGHEQGIATLLGGSGEALLTALISVEGQVALIGPDGQLCCRLDIDWRRGSWYRFTVGVTTAGIPELRGGEVDTGREQASTALQSISGAPAARSVVLAARSCLRRGRQWVPEGTFNGKLENPVIRRAGEEGIVVLDLRFERRLEGARAVDVSGNGYHGTVVNAPLRAATGHRWSGHEIDHTKVPEEYGAIHFHDDDLDDAGWDTSATVSIPPDLASGLYAVRLRAGDAVDHIPFVVTPRPGQGRERIAVLLPTFTYIAYANERMVTRLDFEGDQLSDHPVVPGRHDQELAEHPEWGLSLYDYHSDGSACAFSTHLRPIPNLRPDYRAWLQDAPRHLSADLYLIDWLTERGDKFDVITDHDLNASGARLLDAYDVVLTGSHPEYVSERMLDALECHLGAGGSLMYLGGNGFYWVTSQDAQRPHLIEVRRGPAGTRPSEGAPGEGTHSTTGEPGGLWRQRGRWPNSLTGIGMTAQGWDAKAPGYRRTVPNCTGEDNNVRGRTEQGATTDGTSRVLDLVFAGVDDDIVGDFGLIMGGASGDELDRFDPDRGSPPETVVLATSTGHSDYYQLAGEDVLATRPNLGGSTSGEVRSDMVWLEKSAGGAVFSVGSICYTGSLSHNNYVNNISTVTGNALREMLSRPRKPTL